jgi:tRNA A-37 threonylcarbamoyl transferase component Bud32
VTLPPTESTSPAGADVPEPPGYEILGELGRGGMGVVYKARQTQLNRLVALKMILAGGYAGPEERARFKTEAEAIARLQHPNIVQIYEVGEHDGRPFFTLEFVPDGSLASTLDGSPWNARRAAALVEILARAVHAMHGRGILHRDLKPANVLLTADGQPKITDLGLARQMDAGTGQTASGAVLGTPSYMAPEQARGKKQEVGPAADVYALGAILYELLTARPPFQADTPLDILQQVVSEEPVPPGQLHPGLSGDLEAVSLKCLRKKPAERYASAEELAEDLRQFLNGEPVKARRLSGREFVGRWLRQRLATKLLVGVACLYLLIVAVTDARINASFTAIPLMAAVLVPFLWPRKVIFGASLIAILTLLCLNQLENYYLLTPGPSRWTKITHTRRRTDFVLESAVVHTGLNMGRGLLLGIVGLAFSLLMNRRLIVTTLGALFGFAVGYRSLATGLLGLLVPGELPLDVMFLTDLFGRLIQTFAMPDPFGLELGPSWSNDWFWARFHVGLVRPSAVVCILAIGFLPAGVGAFVAGAAIAEPRQRPPTWRQKIVLAAGAAAVAVIALWAWAALAADVRARSFR